MRTSLSMVGFLLCACGVPQGLGTPTDDYLAHRSEIVGGTTDTGDPAVVAITVGGGGQYEQFCTGTLVGPKTVVTAAHCINAYGNQYAYFVNFGTYASQPSSVVGVASQTADPQYDPNNGDSHDFGVLQLKTAVTNVTPILMNSIPLSQGDIGKTIRHAGYGVTSGSQQGAGTKRQVSYGIRQITAALIESGANGKQTCNGDSGGPALMVMPGSSAEQLVGVVSFGDQNCAQFGEDGRIDVDLAWIKQTMGPWEAPSCSQDGKCVPGCTPVDQDCACVADGVCSADCADPARDPDCPKDCVANGVCATESCGRPDPDCVVEGGACSSEIQCRGRACVSDDQHPAKYCSLPCTPGSTVCPEGMECTSQLVCQLKQKTPKQPGERCFAADDQCVGGTLCTGPAGGFSRCVQGCSAQTDCAAGSTCEGGADGARFCRPPESVLAFDDISIPLATGEGPAAPGCASTGLGELSLVSTLLALWSLRRRSRT